MGIIFACLFWIGVLLRGGITDFQDAPAYSAGGAAIYWDARHLPRYTPYDKLPNSQPGVKTEKYANVGYQFLHAALTPCLPDTPMLRALVIGCLFFAIGGVASVRFVESYLDSTYAYAIPLIFVGCSGYLFLSLARPLSDVVGWSAVMVVLAVASHRPEKAFLIGVLIGIGVGFREQLLLVLLPIPLLLAHDCGSWRHWSARCLKTLLGLGVVHACLQAPDLWLCENEVAGVSWYSRWILGKVALVRSADDVGYFALTVATGLLCYATVYVAPLMVVFLARPRSRMWKLAAFTIGAVLLTAIAYGGIRMLANASGDRGIRVPPRYFMYAIVPAMVATVQFWKAFLQGDASRPAEDRVANRFATHCVWPLGFLLLLFAPLFIRAHGVRVLTTDYTTETRELCDYFKAERAIGAFLRKIPDDCTFVSDSQCPYLFMSNARTLHGRTWSIASVDSMQRGAHNEHVDYWGLSRAGWLEGPLPETITDDRGITFRQAMHAAWAKNAEIAIYERVSGPDAPAGSD